MMPRWLMPLLLVSLALIPVRARAESEQVKEGRRIETVCQTLDEEARTLPLQERLDANVCLLSLRVKELDLMLTLSDKDRCKIISRRSLLMQGSPEGRTRSIQEARDMANDTLNLARQCQQDAQRLSHLILQQPPISY